MRCSNCKSPMPPKGGYVVIESEVEEGLGLVVIKAEALDPDAAGEHICGLLCLNFYASKKFGELAGVKPLFSTGVAL